MTQTPEWDIVVVGGAYTDYVARVEASYDRGNGAWQRIPEPRARRTRARQPDAAPAILVAWMAETRMEDDALAG